MENLVDNDGVGKIGRRSPTLASRRASCGNFSETFREYRSHRTNLPIRVSKRDLDMQLGDRDLGTEMAIQIFNCFVYLAWTITPFSNDATFFTFWLQEINLY